jgi:hypothetical protein
MKGAFPKLLVQDIKEFPLPNSFNSECIATIVDFILFIKSLDDKTTISDFVPNNHIVQLFDEVLDALVYELYFEDDFEKADIKFMKYANIYFESIKGLTIDQKMDTINRAYLKLTEKDNEIRQNLKLMDTRLRELIMPIKSSL